MQNPQTSGRVCRFSSNHLCPNLIWITISLLLSVNCFPSGLSLPCPLFHPVLWSAPDLSPKLSFWANLSFSAKYFRELTQLSCFLPLQQPQALALPSWLSNFWDSSFREPSNIPSFSLGIYSSDFADVRGKAQRGIPYPTVYKLTVIAQARSIGHMPLHVNIQVSWGSDGNERQKSCPLLQPAVWVPWGPPHALQSVAGSWNAPSVVPCWLCICALWSSWVHGSERGSE